MSVLNELKDRVERARDGLQTYLVRSVLMRHTSDILDLQSKQLLEGKASSGDDIRPYYSEDLKPSGYFNTTESAGRYSSWKQGLSYPYSVQRNPDAPNLYVNGKFHSELGVFYDADSVEVVGASQYARNIISKYGVSTFGLMQEYWNEVFRERGALGELIESLKNEIYGG